MTKYSVFLITLFLTSFLVLKPSQAFSLELKNNTSWSFPKKTAQRFRIQEDLKLILKTANWPLDLIQFRHTPSPQNQVHIHCKKGRFQLEVKASDQEWGATLYYGLQKLGFLFPHPRWQITPLQKQARKACHKTFSWKPTLKYRGFHFHTQHPSEWTHGFLMGQTQIATDTIRWLARNGQNLLQVVLLKTIPPKTQSELKALFQIAQEFGLYTGLSISFAFGQQKSFALFKKIEVLLNFFGYNLKQRLEQRIQKFLHRFTSDFITLEIGSSEFTKTNEFSTLKWINITHQALSQQQRQLFVKIHVSNNQTTQDGSNFNFLPARAHPDVGVLPHTVMFYALEDSPTPVYGRQNFKDMKAFLLQQSSLRPTLYFPETSYFVAFDIDIPLLLTDYLIARTEDLKFLRKNNVTGQLNFSTGQELGYWLFDWQVALSANEEHSQNPLSGLQLLGEDSHTWQHILSFQNTFLKQKQLIRVISSSTLLDELWGLESPHERIPLFRAHRFPQKLSSNLKSLTQALQHLPSLEKIKNAELKSMLKVTWLRLRHAHSLRKAITLQGEPRQRLLQNAKRIRQKAADEMALIQKHFSRYPKALIFKKHENITSYPYGYGWPAATLHFWKREEEMLNRRFFFPWTLNIYNPWRLLL